MASESFIEKNKVWLLPLIGILLIGGVVYSMRGAADSAGMGVAINQAYYSDDDGKTYFADSLERRCPFDHNGKQAYRAFVFTCPDKPAPFVAFLGRHSDVRVVGTNGMTGDAPAAVAELKKPGKPEWVSSSSEAGRLMTTVTCGGGGSAQSVIPGS